MARSLVLDDAQRSALHSLLPALAAWRRRRQTAPEPTAEGHGLPVAPAAPMTPDVPVT
ncbi:hypothetical protein ABT297_29705 [Dactylosporangium sp. NPDC000555]|uniref:hypothetical protein n=1 Tax=Dactylosporangium sp. NPDC000555 TaxID=3154260 RepID=UPI0033173FF7